MTAATPRDITAALDALGTSGDHVAGALAYAGHRGNRGLTASCPLASYLRTVPGVAVVRVHANRVQVWTRRFVKPVAPAFEVPLPDGAKQFVQWWDAAELRRWPVLELGRAA